MPIGGMSKARLKDKITNIEKKIEIININVQTSISLFRDLKKLVHSLKRSRKKK